MSWSQLGRRLTYIIIEKHEKRGCALLVRKVGREGGGWTGSVGGNVGMCQR